MVSGRARGRRETDWLFQPIAVGHVGNAGWMVG